MIQFRHQIVNLPAAEEIGPHIGITEGRFDILSLIDLIRSQLEEKPNKIVILPPGAVETSASYSIKEAVVLIPAVDTKVVGVIAARTGHAPRAAAQIAGKAWAYTVLQLLLVFVTISVLIVAEILLINLAKSLASGPEIGSALANNLVF